jgi:hypothetical protein
MMESDCRPPEVSGACIGYKYTTAIVVSHMAWCLFVSVPELTYLKTNCYFLHSNKAQGFH